MKSLFYFVFFISVTITGVSCKKNEGMNDCITGSRRVRFSLFTSKDFSTDNHIITFALVIRKSDRVIWDSLLPPMKLRDIPALESKLVVEKILPGTDPSLLEAGFVYAIENVGLSWYWDKVDECQAFKDVELDFQ